MRKIKATIIPEFNTKAEGSGLVSLIFFIITKTVITTKNKTIRSLIMKKK